MPPGMFYEGFLIDPPERLPLALHGLLWEFPNSQATLGGGGSYPADILGYNPPLG